MKGSSPNSRAALKRINAERARKKNARRPHLAPFRTPERMAAVRAAKARKRMIETEFPFVTPRDEPVRDIPDNEGGAATPPVVQVPPSPAPAAPSSPILEPPVTIPEETDGERRARLAKRDYDLFVKGGARGQQELARLRASEPSGTWTRVSPEMRSRLGLDKL